MKLITKYNSNIKNMNVYAYLHPHPLDIEYNGDFEVDEISWIPGFDSSDIGEDGEHPFFRDQNINLYSKIEKLTVEKFNTALQNLNPLLDSYLINSIQIAIDITGNYFTTTSTLAAYNFEETEPQKGNYVFHMTPTYLRKLLITSNQGKELDLKCNTIWEHEIIHMLDHSNLVKTSVFGNSNLSNDCFRNYILHYRDEGIAELYYLLNGGSIQIKSLNKAIERFELNIKYAKQKCDNILKLTDEQKNELVKTYDFYELGPWIILSILKQYDGGFHNELISEVIKKVEDGKKIDQAVILDVIKIALRIKGREFLLYTTKE